MKLSLDTAGHGVYFTARGEMRSLEEIFKRAGKFGCNAACIYAHLPLFESFEPNFVRNTVRSMKGLMVYSRGISIAFLEHALFKLDYYTGHKKSMSGQPE